MTSPNHPPQRFVAGAIDLGALAQRNSTQGATAGAAGPAVGANASGVTTSVHVSPSSIKRDVLEQSTRVAVVLQIGTARSPESEAMRAVFDAEVTQQDHIRWIFAHLEADDYPELVQSLGCRALPTVLALVQGQPIAEFQGAQPREALVQWIDAIVNATRHSLPGIASTGSADADESALSDALRAYDVGDYELCAVLCAQRSTVDPAHDKAWALLMRRADEASALAGDADSLIEAADTDVDNIDKQIAAAKAESLTKSAEAGFERLLKIVGTRVGKEKDACRQALVDLLELFPDNDERVRNARRRLTSLLY